MIIKVEMADVEVLAKIAKQTFRETLRMIIRKSSYRNTLKRLIV